MSIDSITKIDACLKMKKCGIKAENIAEQLGIHRATVFRWTGQIKLYGIKEFKRRYRNAKKGKRKRFVDPKNKVGSEESL